MDFIERLKKEDTEEEEKEIQAAKQLFCEAFNLVYGDDLTISGDEKELFYSVEETKAENYPGVFSVQLMFEHKASKYCLTKNRGYHSICKKSRSYTVSIRKKCVWQKCWTPECTAKPHKGRRVILLPEESSDDDEPVFLPAAHNDNKKRKRR